MRHPQVISMLAEIYRPETYLELGLYQGETFRAALPHCGRAIGVDINNISLPGEIHQSTTDEFFAKFSDTVDMVFIDADHKYESAKQDFENSLRLLSAGGIIIIHDVDPIHDKYFDFGYCGDSYRLIPELEQDERVNVTTLPVDHEGLALITRKNATRVVRRHFG